VAEPALNRPKKSDKLSVRHDFNSDKRQAQEVFSVGEAVEKPVAEITVKGRVAQEVFGQLADDHLSPRAGRMALKASCSASNKR
jgi:hypothetical protein